LLTILLLTGELIHNSDMLDDENILSTEQVASILGVSTHYVRVLCQSGRLDCFKLGREWLIRRAGVEEYQRTRRPPGRPHKIKPNDLEET
jgi:excisionase family DNA binding protein